MVSVQVLVENLRWRIPQTAVDVARPMFGP